MSQPLHGVILHRYEDASIGGDDADRPGRLHVLGPLEAGEDAPYVQGIFFVGPTGGVGTLDKLCYVSRDPAGNLCFRDPVAATEYSLQDLAAGGGGGISPATHRSLDQLTHLVAETSFDEIIKTGSKITSIITWTTSGKTTKIREANYTYTGNKVATVTTIHYDAAGVAITGESMLETYAYTGSVPISVTRVVS